MEKKVKITEQLWMVEKCERIIQNDKVEKYKSSKLSTLLFCLIPEYSWFGLNIVYFHRKWIRQGLKRDISPIWNIFELLS